MAKQYYKDQGNLDVPVRYVTKTSQGDYFALGKWIATQRKYKNTSTLLQDYEKDRIHRLDVIGMVWDVIDYRWEANFQMAKQYYEEHGNLEMSTKYVTDDGVALGRWLSSLRSERKKKGGAGTCISEEQIRRLDEIGMIWDSNLEYRWRKAYKAACTYYRKNGHLKVPHEYQTEEGILLGRWVERQRALLTKTPKEKMSRERIAREKSMDESIRYERIHLLNQIGMNWGRAAAETVKTVPIVTDKRE